MTVTFAEKLARIPHYEPGTSLDDAKAQRRDRRCGQARLERVAVPAAPDGGRGDRRGRPRAINRYPDPDAHAAAPRAIADRHETEPGRIAVSNGSCEILLAAAEALCEPGDEILYAWPSFSMYPYLPALSGAREIRVPLADGDVHDLDAMLDGGHRRDPAADRLQPEQPDRDPPAGRADRRLLRERPRPHVTIILDEAYIEFQTNDDPDATLDLLAELPEPRPAAHLQQVPRAGRPAGRLRALLAAVPGRGRRRAPAVQRQRARPGRRRPRRSATRTTSPTASRRT